VGGEIERGAHQNRTLRAGKWTLRAGK